MWYVENQSFKLDMYIIYKTIVNTLQKKDINAPNHVTAEKFKGITYEQTSLLIGMGGHSK